MILGANQQCQGRLWTSHNATEKKNTKASGKKRTNASVLVVVVIIEQKFSGKLWLQEGSMRSNVHE